MKYVPSICPKCNEIILVRYTLPFVVCAICRQSISSGEAIDELETAILNPAMTSDLITKCLKLEKMFDGLVPLAVMQKIIRAHPDNEQVAYLIVRFNDYNPIEIKRYLAKFAEIERKIPFAEDFLEKAMTVRNMAFAEELTLYIENKLPPSAQNKWIKKLRELKTEYVGARADSGLSKPFLYTYYSVCTAINIAAAVMFIFLNLGFLLSGLVMVALFIVEIGVLFWHNRWYGNRITLSKTERLLMTIFMCSLPVTLGGVFLGAIF